MSIINGRTGNDTNEEVVDDEDDEDDDDEEDSHVSRTTSSSNSKNRGSTKSTFSFSLPFSLPDSLPNLPNLPNLKDLKLGSSSRRPRTRSRTKVKHASVSTAEQRSPSKHAIKQFSKKTISLPLFNNSNSPSESASASDEEREFTNVRQMDNGHFRAVKDTLLSSISIDNVFKIDDGFPEFDGDVVIMGGYRGSILRDSHTGKRVWIPLKVGLNIRKINLEIGLSDQDEADVTKDLYPDGMLTNIGPVDVSRRLKRRLAMNANCNVVEFGYDWRISCEIVVDQFIDFLKQLPSAKTKGVMVIAHSMGGLIAHSAMQREPSLFRGLLYAGVPQQCVNILGPFRNGENVLLSSKVLAADVTFSMRSSFVFFPLDGQCFVDKRTGEELRVDFFDPHVWTRYHLSPCTAPPSSSHNSNDEVEGSVNSKYAAPQEPVASRKGHVPVDLDLIFSPRSSTSVSSHHHHHHHHRHNHQEPKFEQKSYDEAAEYLSRVLTRTKAFKESLFNKDPLTNYPPLTVIYSRSIPTVRGARVNGEQDIFEGNYSDMIFSAGDGVVAARNVMPEKVGYSVVKKIVSEKGHVGLLSDVHNVGIALKAILDEENRRLNEKKSQK
ncbi:hypothetical protein V1514DRAFT_286822 [Lipomyces japonicus]|uniref:uncharacterized protein n=1 Tax=Lipomyces japonicus TaxID=56871 RepID=UPI0034CE2E53